MRLTLLFFMLFVSGCSDLFNPEQALMKKYHERLANVLGVSSAEITPSPPVTIPARRDLFQSLPRLSLGLLESYQLRQCGLFNLVAAKNSQLGKVQDAFHDLDYQISLLKTLRFCLTDFPLSAEEKAKLEQIYSQKWHHFQTHLDNLLLTSRATQKQFTASDWLAFESKNQIAQVSDAFKLLNDLYVMPYLATSRLPDVSLVDYQEEIEKSRLVGRLYYALANSALWLSETTRMLESNQSKILCSKNRDTTQFQYLNNVFQLIYIKEVQPYLAYLDGTYQRLDVGIELIEKRMHLHGENYGLIEAHNTFRKKTLEHVKFWQGLFKRCNVSVGNTNQVIP